jgi:hypothetical protein
MSDCRTIGFTINGAPKASTTFDADGQTLPDVLRFVGRMGAREAEMRRRLLQIDWVPEEVGGDFGKSLLYEETTLN